MPAQISSARDPELVETTSRLLEFLRDLAAVRQDPVRDVADYLRVHWLAELPRQATTYTDAGLGRLALMHPVTGTVHVDCLVARHLEARHVLVEQNIGPLCFRFGPEPLP